MFNLNLLDEKLLNNPTNIKLVLDLTDNIKDILVLQPDGRFVNRKGFDEEHFLQNGYKVLYYEEGIKRAFKEYF